MHSDRRSSTVRLASAMAALIVTGLVVAACTGDGRDMRPPRPDQYPATTVRETLP
jgi:hypothetical protein